MKLFTKSVAVVVISLLPSISFADFGGIYVGGALNGFSSEVDGIDDPGTGLDKLPIGDEIAFTGFAGYQLQNGDFVYGGEVALSSVSGLEALPEGDFNDSVEADSITIDIKARVGYVVDSNLMVYGTAGFSAMTIEIENEEFDADGFVIGAGVDYLINESFVVGAEFSNRNVEASTDLDSDPSLSVNALGIRAAFRF